jgi:hypothetical protein
MLPRRVFSEHFVDFVNKCLKDNVNERSNLAGLVNDPFYKQNFGDRTTLFFNFIINFIIFREG